MNMDARQGKPSGKLHRGMRAIQAYLILASQSPDAEEDEHLHSHGPLAIASIERADREAAKEKFHAPLGRKARFITRPLPPATLSSCADCCFVRRAALAMCSSTMALMLMYCGLEGPKVARALRREDCS